MNPLLSHREYLMNPLLSHREYGTKWTLSCNTLRTKWTLSCPTVSTKWTLTSPALCTERSLTCPARLAMATLEARTWRIGGWLSMLLIFLATNLRPAQEIVPSVMDWKGLLATNQRPAQGQHTANQRTSTGGMPALFQPKSRYFSS